MQTIYSIYRIWKEKYKNMDACVLCRGKRVKIGFINDHQLYQYINVWQKYQL